MTSNVLKTRIKFDMVLPEMMEKATFIDDDFYTNPAINPASILKNTHDKQLEYMTFERGRVKADGTSYMLPDPLQNKTYTGIWSRAIAEEDGKLKVDGVIAQPKLVINFSATYNMAGITFEFDKLLNGYPINIIATYKNNNTIIKTVSFEPDSWDYVCEYGVENFNRIELTFDGWSVPHNFLRITRMAFGLEKVFTETELMSADIQKSVSLISNELKVGMLNFTVYSENESFNPLKPGGIYKALQKNSECSVTKIQDNTEVLIGKYYLDTWDAINETTMKFTAIDVIGRAANYPSMPIDGGYAAWIFEDMFKNVDIPYRYPKEFDENANEDDYFLNAVIKAGSIRDSLQHFAFATQTIVLATPEGVVDVKQIDKTRRKWYINKTQKRLGETIKIKPCVTGIEITGHSLHDVYDKTLNSGSKIFEGHLNAGVHYIHLEKMIGQVKDFDHNLGLADTAERNRFILKITMYRAGKISVVGEEAIDVKERYWRTLLETENVVENVIRIDSYDVSEFNQHPWTPGQLLDHLEWYFGMRVEESFQMDYTDYINGPNISEKGILESGYNQKIEGYIEKLDIDLVKDLANVTVVGNVLEE